MKISTLCACLLSLSMLFTFTAAAAGEERKTIKKTFELTNNAKSIEFTLTGYDGPFTSKLTLPGGYVIKNDKSSEMQTKDGTSWVHTFRIASPDKGAYEFEITAPKIAYYNLEANIPLFSDITSHWAGSMINDFVQRGIVSGYGDGSFGPNDFVTGEALVKMAVLSLTKDQPNGKRNWTETFRWKVRDEAKSMELGWLEYSFIPAKGEKWSTPYLNAANDLGITSNWSNDALTNSFKRKDVALLIGNIVGMVHSDEIKPATFADTKSLSQEYIEAINIVNTTAIFSGYPDGTFQPEKPVTRAEAVKVLYILGEYLK